MNKRQSMLAKHLQQLAAALLSELLCNSLQRWTLKNVVELRTKLHYLAYGVGLLTVRLVSYKQ